MSTNNFDNVADGLIAVWLAFWIVVFGSCLARTRCMRRSCCHNFEFPLSAQEEARNRRMTIIIALQNAISTAPANNSPPQGMSLEERQEFLSNNLKSKIYTRQANDKRNGDDLHLNESGETESTDSNCSGIHIDVSLDDDDEEAPGRSLCAICLDAFENGDEICLSEHPMCQHVFHKECIFEWLLKNGECPICRRNYLNIGDNNDLESGGVAAEGSPGNDIESGGIAAEASSEPHATNITAGTGEAVEQDNDWGNSNPPSPQAPDLAA